MKIMYFHEKHDFFDVKIDGKAAAPPGGRAGERFVARVSPENVFFYWASKERARNLLQTCTSSSF